MRAGEEASENRHATHSAVVGPVALKTILILLTIHLFLALLHIGATWQDDGTLPGRVIRFFHLDREGNLPTWFASTQIFCLALAFAGLWYLERSPGGAGRGKWLWLICAAGALFLSLDEGAAFHEMLGTLLGLLFSNAPEGSWLHSLKDFPSYYWLLLYTPLVLPLALVLLVFVTRRVGRNRYLLFLGGLLFVTGAVGLDYLEGRYGVEGHKGLPMPLGDGQILFDVFLVEELLELSGIAFILAGVLQYTADLVRQRGLRLRERA